MTQYTTQDYSNWPDWMLSWRIQILSNQLDVVNNKIDQEMEIIDAENVAALKAQKRLDRHQHLFYNV